MSGFDPKRTFAELISALVARETVVEELSKAGYTLVREHEFLPRQYFLEFSVAP